MDLCIVNRHGELLAHRPLQAAPAPFLKAMAPDREARVVGVACLLTRDLARCPLRPGGEALRPGPCPRHAGEPRGQGHT